MSTIRVSITEINSSQLASWPGANAESQTWLQVVDLPNKPLFRWNGSMWVPVTGSVILDQNAVSVAVPADATEDIVRTVNVPAGLLGLNGWVRVTNLWITTNSVNNKTSRVRYSGAAGTVAIGSPQANSTGYKTVVEIANRNSVASQSTQGFIANTGAAILASIATSVVDTSAATSIVITGQKASAGETMTLESTLVEAFPG